MKRKAFTLVEPFGFAHGKLPVVRKGETKGFTLVELLVVIAIIVLLLAIIAPTFSNAIAMGRATTCRNNLKKLGQAFTLSSTTRAQKGYGQIVGGVTDLYPEAVAWPGIPWDVTPEAGIYACPEDAIVETVAGSLADLEYESEHGRFSLDGPGSYDTMFKKRRGTCAQGAYTEYLFQDDFSSQYNQMDFNGWIDSDGGIRMYDSGVIHVFQNLEVETADSVPDWAGAHGHYPTGINTCGNTNNILYRGTGAFNGDPRVQSNRGQDFLFPDWGSGTNYGINSYAYKASFGSTVIVLVDYTDTIVDVDFASEAQGFLLDSARHLGKVNCLRANGSVTPTTPMEISPLLQIQKWK